MFMVKPASMGSDKQASKLVLKNEFLTRARSLSNLPEVYRGPRLVSLLAEALAIGIRAEAEFFLAAYGDFTGQGYWYVQLLEPILLYKFAYALAVHVAESADQLEPATVALIWAFRDAAEAGEDWRSAIQHRFSLWKTDNAVLRTWAKSQCALAPRSTGC